MRIIIFTKMLFGSEVSESHITKSLQEEIIFAAFLYFSLGISRE